MPTHSVDQHVQEDVEKSAMEQLQHFNTRIDIGQGGLGKVKYV